MSQYVNSSEQQWDRTDVIGVRMDRCVLWNGGHNVFTGLFRMPAGMRLPLHHHGEWVQVLVIEGSMQVASKDGDRHTVEAGGYYFVEPGDAHVEEALVDTLVLVSAQVGTMQAGHRVLP